MSFSAFWKCSCGAWNPPADFRCQRCRKVRSGLDDWQSSYDVNPRGPDILRFILLQFFLYVGLPLLAMALFALSR